MRVAGSQEHDRPIKLSVANRSYRRVLISALAVVSVMLGSIPAYLGTPSAGEQPTTVVTVHSYSALFQTANSQLSAKRVVAFKRVWRVDVTAHGAFELSKAIGCGWKVPSHSVPSLIAAELIQAPIRAPPQTSA